ncbi:hypothetical protein DFO73_101176 [Cytobacillus oceanisediminis]|uniref:Uncharacterized protein n=1 Tax=Cytobacillus oceanisediminis TaxID=665099 RepID=A0A2V3A5S7_9BACI|nr:hypothetical protein [Cytobacillus oceanisediminis]PWW31918.1 hypothetical protein DFO73_101176 [Cytobacillus oceanisediminis]
MAIQFLDLRVSQHSNNDGFTTPIPTAPDSLTFGIIGVQTAGVSPENAGDIRVLLNGYVKVEGITATTETLTLRIFRDGIQIFETSVGPLAAETGEVWGFSAADFPPDPSGGQLDYTVTIESDLALSTAVIAAANFSGVAAAGAGVF